MTIYRSPAEHNPILMALGPSSSVPESWGFDFCWTVNGKIAGVQRKEVKDFRASVHDGRLVKEVSQMQHDFITLAILVIEGINKWTTDGQLYDEYEQFTEAQHNGLLLSIQDRGIRVLHTNDIAGTARVIQSTYNWSQKSRHTSLDVRAKAKSKWIHVDDRDKALHLLQSFEGISAITAEKIWEHCGRRVPLAWTFNSVKELMEIPGIGKVRAKAMWEMLNPPQDKSKLNRTKEKVSGN